MSLCAMSHLRCAMRGAGCAVCGMWCSVLGFRCSFLGLFSEPKRLTINPQSKFKVLEVPFQSAISQRTIIPEFGAFITKEHLCGEKEAHITAQGDIECWSNKY